MIPCSFKFTPKYNVYNEQSKIPSLIASENTHSYSRLCIEETRNRCHQCDQIGRYFGLWATF